MSETKRRKPEEIIEELDKKVEQIKARKQKLQAQVGQKERKERTRRLIQIGAIFETNLKLKSVEEAQERVEYFQAWEEFLQNVMNEQGMNKVDALSYIVEKSMNPSTELKE